MKIFPAVDLSGGQAVPPERGDLGGFYFSNESNIILG